MIQAAKIISSGDTTGLIGAGVEVGLVFGALIYWFCEYHLLRHIIFAFEATSSGNPLGVSGNYDRLPFAPHFIFKDLITIFIFIIVLSVFVLFMPNILGDSEI